MRVSLCVSALAFMAMAGALVLADEVKKTDGTTIEGQVIEDEADHVTIRNKLGDIRIARKEVASVKRTAPKGVDADLEKLKTSTAEKLESLAKTAEKDGRPDAARSLRSRIEEVKRWAIPTTEPAKRPAAAALDWLEVVQRFVKIDRDASLTEVQRKASVEALAKEIDAKPVVGRMTITDVEMKDGRANVSGVAGPYKTTWFLEDEGDMKKLSAAKKGDEIVVEGLIYHEGKLKYLPGINRTRLR